MKTMVWGNVKRRLFNVLWALLLLLCLACAMLWVRGGFVVDRLSVGYGNNGRGLIADSRAGNLNLQVREWSPPRQEFGPWHWDVTPRSPQDRGTWEWYLPLWYRCPPQFLWFHCGPLWYRCSATYPNGVLYMWELFLPYWLLILATAVPPGIWLWKRYRRKSSDIDG